MYFIILIAALGTCCVNSLGLGFSNPPASPPILSWQIGTFQTVEWETVSTSDSYLWIVGNNGEGFSLDGYPTISPFQFGVGDNLDVRNNPWHFALLNSTDLNTANVLLYSGQINVVPASAASSTTAPASTTSSTTVQSVAPVTVIKTAAPTTVLQTVIPTSLPSSTVAAPPSATVSSVSATPVVASSNGFPHSTAASIGVGLGIGIPLLITAIAVTTILMRRRSIGAKENSTNRIQYVDEAIQRPVELEYVDEGVRRPVELEHVDEAVQRPVELEYVDEAVRRPVELGESL